MTKAIAYYRVSRERQGRSGLGLEAQKQAVQEFIRTKGYTLISEFTEVESGRKSKRPMLLQALDACKKEKATLLIAKLNRLTRSVAFVSMLMEAHVDFRAVDNPYAGKMVVYIMVAFAEQECDETSERTKAALKIAKLRGVELGKNGRYVLSVQNKQKAKEFALMMLPTIRQLQQKGITTVRAIVKALNRRHIPTYRHDGSKWHVATVHKVMHVMDQKNTDNETTQ